MADQGDAAYWRCDDGIAGWLSGAGAREARRTAQRRLMAELLGFADDDPFVFLDLGAGTGAATKAVLDRYPRSSAVLADVSSQMADAGEQALHAYRGRFRYIEVDLAAGDPWPSAAPERFDAVISSLVLHHIPEARQQALLVEVLALLTPGSWFLDLDLLSAEDPLVEAAWHTTASRIDPESTAERQRRQDHHGSLHVTTLARQLGGLRAAGFVGVDVYWKQLDTAILGGRRPPS